MSSKFSNINDLMVDEDLVVDGVELAFGNGRFITILRTGASNRKYKTAMAREFKPYTSATGMLTSTDEEATELLKNVYAEAVVIDWRGFNDAADNAIPFNKENCIELFTEAPDLFDIVQGEAAKFSNFARRGITASGK